MPTGAPAGRRRSPPRRCCSCSSRSSPAALQVHLTVFALAIVIGYYVIGHVHHALHTPLMSVTNAISGIIVVGALLQIGHGDAVVTALAFVAILLASINVFGGFAVTRRMLGHVLAGARDWMIHVHRRNRRHRGVHRRRPAVHPGLAGLSKHETSGPATPSASPAWRSRWSRPSRWRSPATSNRSASALLVGAMVDRRRDRAVAGPGGRDDRDARADRAAAQLRRPGRGAGRLERLPARRRRPRRGRGRAAGTSEGMLGIHSAEVVHRRVHRRGHLHRLDRGLPQAVGADQVHAADAARQEHPQPRRAGRVRRADGVVRHRPAAVAAGRRHRAGAAARLAPGRLDRRRRHARRGVDAQQLLGLGRGRVGLPARQRPADHHRRPGRLLRCLPVLHHVQGDEPVVHLRHRRRLRHRGRPGRRQGLRRAPRDHRRGRRRTARRRPTR